MIKDLTDFTVICTWTTLHLANHLSLALTRPSVFMPACAKWQGGITLFDFFKHDKKMSERKTEQVRHCLRTATPSLSVFLSICLSAKLSAFGASCLAFVWIFLFMPNLSPAVSIPLPVSKVPVYSFCLSSLYIFNPEFQGFRAELLLFSLPSRFKGNSLLSMLSVQSQTSDLKTTCMVKWRLNK